MNRKKPEPGGIMAETDSRRAGVHVLALAWAILLMMVGSVAPLVFADAEGKPLHGSLLFLLWSMSAAFVRGVGFIPRQPLIRWLLSGWASVGALLLGLLLRHLAW